MIINHNMNAMNAHRNMMGNTASAGRSMEKLSSGLRINKAGDDAAGLAISEKMRGQIRGLDQAGRNAQDGISMIQTAEGALSETHSILQRMRELAVQSSNDTNTDNDRDEIQKEINQLTSEITRIGNNTEFNTKKVINGDMTGGGSAATGGSVTLDFSTAPANGNTFNLKVGEDTWVVTIDGSDATNDADAVDLTNKTMTIDLASGTLTGAALANDLQAVLDDLANGTNNSGANATLATDENLSNFTFADTASRLTITASNSGDFAGARDARLMISASGGTLAVDEVNATDGTDGTGGSADLQIGANNGQQFVVAIDDMRAKTNLKISGDSGAAEGTVTNAVYATTNALTDKSGVAAEYALDVTSATKATAAIEVLDNAINTVSAERSKLGAYQNRLEHTIANLGTSSENLTSAESRIRDVDMAKEMMSFSKNNILSQAAQAMLAQANQQPQGVLQLLR